MVRIKLASVNALSGVLTTISHPQDKLGSMAAELLLRLILGEELTEQELHIRVEPEIVVRDSTWKR